MKLNKTLTNATLVFVMLSLVMAQTDGDRTRLGESRRLVLPAYSILDEAAQPLLSADGKYGFVASVTDGSLISFNTATGKLLSSLVVGESVGPIAMVESESQRLIAVPAANLPAADHPATVSIIDATRPRSLALRAQLLLPIKAQITPTTPVLLAKNGKYCVIASSFDEPTLYSFNIETSALVSQVPLLGRPSEVAFYDDGERRQIAIASAAANQLSLVTLDNQGQLMSSATFAPTDARLEEVNNPAFSSDGRTIYIASASANKIFAFDVAANRLLDSVDVDAPQRITTAAGVGNVEWLGVTRIRRPANVRGGGVTTLKHHQNRLVVQAHFSPPEGIEFSRANNVAFNRKASAAFIASTTGVLFAFSTETGELDSYQVVGNELRRIYVSDNGKRVAAVRSNTGGDEVVITSFEEVSSTTTKVALPVITTLKPDLIELGYAKNLRIQVQGQGFADGDALVVNGVEVATELSKSGSLEAQLPKSLFKQTGDISVQVKRANGGSSLPVSLHVTKPQAPVIDSLTPERVPAPTSSFTIRVKGRNFRPSSAIFVDGQQLPTQQNGGGELQARVGSVFTRSIKQLSIEVRDETMPNLVSNARVVNVVGPTIDTVEPFNDVVVAGDRSFGMKVTGENFRDGARVEVNGELVPASLTKRLSSRVMIATVPGRFTQQAKALAIKVRTPAGDLSNAVTVDARAPEISAVASGSIIAGVKSARVDLRGENFRRRARVTVTDDEGRTYKVSPRRVRFRSSKQIIVTFTGQLKGLLAKPGKLKVQVVNPNKTDGVVSEEQVVTVAGPEVGEALITAIENDDSNVRLLINGANFRKQPRGSL